MNAKAWFYGQSFHNDTDAPAPAEKPKPTHEPVELWDGTKWITVMVPVPEVAR
jgi:hypothetical protein